MIFVAVGTTQFDELVESIDNIAPRLNDDVVIQIGNSKYIPNNCKYLTFDEELITHFKKANIIIAHGGAGITFEVLSLGKKLISIENPHTLGGHQKDLLEKLSNERYLIWCKDLNKIDSCIKDTRKIREYVRPECGIGEMIVRFLG